MEFPLPYNFSLSFSFKYIPWLVQISFSIDDKVIYIASNFESEDHFRKQRIEWPNIDFNDSPSFRRFEYLCKLLPTVVIGNAGAAYGPKPLENAEPLLKARITGLLTRNVLMAGCYFHPRTIEFVLPLKSSHYLRGVLFSDDCGFSVRYSVKPMEVDSAPKLSEDTLNAENKGPNFSGTYYIVISNGMPKIAWSDRGCFKGTEDNMYQMMCKSASKDFDFKESAGSDAFPIMMRKFFLTPTIKPGKDVELYHFWEAEQEAMEKIKKDWAKRQHEAKVAQNRAAGIAKALETKKNKQMVVNEEKARAKEFLAAEKQRLKEAKKKALAVKGAKVQDINEAYQRDVAEAEEKAKIMVKAVRDQLFKRNKKADKPAPSPVAPPSVAGAQRCSVSSDSDSDCDSGDESDY